MMSSAATSANETRKTKSRLAVLSSSLDELEDHLQPLLSQTLPETLLSLEPLQQAKLLTDIPYVVYDLVFIYLKTRGIDPKTHPVIAELERVKSYFGKIKNAENPPQRTTQVDKAAATRFIQHAISQVTSTSNVPTPSETEYPTSTPAPAAVPVKVTSKMRERAEYEQRLKEGKEGDEEEEDLQVYGNEMAEGNASTRATNTTKRKRPAVDHFAGVGEPESDAEPDVPASSLNLKKKQRFTGSAVSTPVISSPASTPAPSDGAPDPGKKKKKKAKKKKESTIG
ncbi:hypothetical protein E1B28_001608 [Marasmius oreades]|uniref:Exosome complex protein n=1 Tax=Marasmius oreades TaxID=181124 RepID=A0A9P7V3W3_9AGAR|nr:uncharacterized protein E1B28_001608 [Marasmius oreades]KAG7099796.1 hypothetical protein E1B28_001608 [Marasmius oreades]